MGAPVFPEVGEFLQERLVTDTIVYEVVGVTKSTLKVRRCKRGETIKSENRSNPFPCVWTEALPDPDAKVRVVRLRKDGTFRMGQGYSPLRPAERVDGKPAFYTDYRE